MDYGDFLNRDCKTLGLRRQRQHRRRQLSLAVLLSGIGTTVILLGAMHNAEATRGNLPEPSAEGVLVADTPPLSSTAAGIANDEMLTFADESLLDEAVVPPAPADFAEDEVEFGSASTATITEVEVRPWQTVAVAPGDSLSGIFGRLGLNARVLHEVMQSGEEARQLRRLMPGDKLHFDIEGGELKNLHYAPNPLTTIAITRDMDGFRSSLDARTTEVSSNFAEATIESSLFNAGRAAGLSDNLIMELANIFGWDVDFALDIRKGDRFSVLFEEHFLEGEKLHDGAVLAAEFVNQGNVYRAVRFTFPDGTSDYFSEDGRSMRKAFLRSPVDFRRISSRFQPERFHPVLGVKRPHRGVDYAAATGTPIKAAGDGKIISLGTKGGYGRTVIIQHGSQITTLYAHMSRYKSGLKVGSRVRQGQVIGYVGKSGLATGPHLHYEFRVNGSHRNPLTVKLPDAEPIQAAHRDTFRKSADRLLAQLESFGQNRLALKAE